MAAALGLAARAMALDPAYLGEMPTVQQLQVALASAAPLENSARQVCAYNQLFQLVHSVSVSQGRANAGTADEMRVASAYVAAMQTATQAVLQSAAVPDRQNWARLVAQCKDDRSVLDEVLTKFSMSGTRAAYLRADPSFAAAQRASTHAPAAAAAVAPDPSVAKAKAAHIDNTVLGLAIGEALHIPPCAAVRAAGSQGQAGGLGAISSMIQQSGLQGQPVTAICHSEEMDMTALASALTQQSRGSNTAIKFPPDKCPDWMAQCIVYGNVQGGLLESIYVNVGQSGPSDQTVADQLRHKYGTPTSARVDHYKNNYGNSVDMVDLEWVLPGLHIEYRPTLLDQGTSNRWALRAETETSYQHKAAEGRRSEQAKQPL